MSGKKLAKRVQPITPIGLSPICVRAVSQIAMLHLRGGLAGALRRQPDLNGGVVIPFDPHGPIGRHLAHGEVDAVEPLAALTAVGERTEDSRLRCRERLALRRLVAAITPLA